MKKLENGWCVPDGDVKMTGHVIEDASMNDPQYERRQREIILQHIPKKETFIDVGANIGVWSIPLLTKFSKTISYEPSIRNRECLELNLNGRGEIRPYAVGNESKNVTFHDEIKNCGNSKVWIEKEVPGLYNVPMVTLDDQNIKNCSLIKIDVQGFELQVITGSKSLIETQQPWIIFEVSADVDVICKFLEDRNYDMIDNKSKRLFIFAPKSGPMAPKKSAFGRRLGNGPYINLLPEDKQEIARQRHGH